MSMYGLVGALAEDVGFRRGGRVQVGLACAGTSRAKQQFRDECDINTIMRRFQRDGVVSHVARFQGRYEDVTGTVPYDEALRIVMAAEEAFGSLPSSVRLRFENDPAAFVEFATDPKNRGEMVKLGLIPAAEVKPPLEVVVTKTVAPEAPGGAPAKP